MVALERPNPICCVIACTSETMVGMTRRKKVGLAFFAVVLIGFGIYDFWGGYGNSGSIAAGIFSVLVGILSAIWYGGWPAKSKKNSGPPVV